MFLTISKLKNRCNLLGARRYADRVGIAPFIAQVDDLSSDQWHCAPKKDIHGELVDIGGRLEGRDRYFWLNKKTVVPTTKPGFDIVGLFNFGISDAANTSGCECLLYVNGEAYQGVDTNHKEVFFSGLEGQEVDLTFLVWTGLEGFSGEQATKHQCKQAEFAYLHKKTDELYYFAKAIMGMVQIISAEDPAYEDLLGLLNSTANRIDWDSDDERFYASVDEAHSYFMDRLGNMEKNTAVTVHAVGHTHIDLAWLWRVKHTREKAQRSFSTVLRLMERYDEYIFLQSQPWLYQAIKEDVPELYEKIRERVQENRWEPDGGMLVEADCNIPSGEALVRQFLYGTRFFEKEFNKKCEYLWLPDVFGYSWALPQILKQCEIDTFMTTKISWNEYNTIPNDLFFWRGIDGSEILTYFIDTPDPYRDLDARWATYSGDMDARSIIGSWKRFKNKELSKDVLISYGFGDGGGGVTRDQLEMRRAFNALPGCPNVVTDRAGDFFRKMHQNIESTDRYVHIWDGELYLEMHRGTYTTHASNKKANRFLENKLVQLEWLSSVAYILGGEYAQKELYENWKCLLLNQFHDIIPGSSIPEVYEDSAKDYDNAANRLNRLEADLQKKLTKPRENTYTVYSFNSYAGTEQVWMPVAETGHFEDENGRILPSQREEGGYWVCVTTVPFGGTMVTFRKEEKPACEETPFRMHDMGVETPLYRLVWNAAGQLTEIYDKEANRQVLCDGQLGNVLELYEDKPSYCDAWDIHLSHVQKMTAIPANTAAEVVEQGKLRMVVRFTYSTAKSQIQQDMVLYADNKRIDFQTWVDWHEDHKLLKAAFYTDIRSVKATYDIQFGHMERATHWNTSWDWARFECCAHKWADLSENGYGVSLLNDCKYGYSVKDNVIRISLLRSPKDPDPKADMGEHIFTYSLYPHTGSVTCGGTIEQANRLNVPAQVVSGDMTLLRIVELSGECVQVDAIKKAEDEGCLILRLHECRGGHEDVTLTASEKVEKIVPCNMLEHNTGDEVTDNRITFRIKPFEIKTFKLYLRK